MNSSGSDTTEKPERTGMPSLKERVVKGSAAILAGDAYAHALRLLGNLIMTRMLYPEAFGLMLIVGLVFTALQMLSDVGIRDSLISRQSEVQDSDLDTAWTMTIIRGFILAAIAALLAYPTAWFYDQEILAPLMFLVALGPIIQGFASPLPIMSEKKIQLIRVTVWKVGAQTLALGATLVWLFIEPTIWGLAAHGIFFAIFHTLGSHLLFSDYRPQLRLNSASAREFFTFGRWILLATALTFLLRRGDALFVSRAASADLVGIFGIASSLSQVILLVTSALGSSLLKPVYSELRDGNTVSFLPQIRKVKLAILSLCFPIVVVFACFGRDLIALLYDSRYQEAGWMLEIMAAGSTFVAATAVYRPLAISFGDSKRHLWMVLTMSLVLTGCMAVGVFAYGLTGLVIGIAVASAMEYVVVRYFVTKYLPGDYTIDVLFIALMMSLIGTVWYVRGVAISF